VTAILERHADVYLPQRDGGKVVDLVANGVERGAAFKSIYDRDVMAFEGDRRPLSEVASEISTRR
jgi:hypothetical protein